METVTSKSVAERQNTPIGRYITHIAFAGIILLNLIPLIQIYLDETKKSKLYKFNLTNFEFALMSFVLLTLLYAVAIYAQPKISKHARPFTFLVLIFQPWLIIVANNNLFLAYFAGTFVPILYWYWIRFGELMSLFGNSLFIFTVRRHIAIIPMFIAISWFTFFLLNQLVNPVDLLLGVRQVRFGKEELKTSLMIRYGLADENGRPYTFWERYIQFLNGFIHGDLGLSYKDGVPVTENIGNLLWTTLKMQVSALILSFFLSVTIGILAAYYHQTTLDSIISSIALLGLSMPIFVSGILAILIFSGTGLGWFPFGGNKSPDHIMEEKCSACGFKPDEIWNQLWTYENQHYGWQDINLWKDFFQVSYFYTYDSIWHLVLPVLTLTFATMATFSRLTRGTMLEVLREDYILAAKANGLSEKKIVVDHALPNVMLPITTFLGLNIGGILAGAPITETVFTWPGLGKAYIAAIGIFDGPIIVGLTMIITLMILIANMLTDIAYTKLDPRISL